MYKGQPKHLEFFWHQKLDSEGNNFNQKNKTKAFMKNSQLKSFCGERLNVFHTWSGTRQGSPISPLLINTELEILAVIIRQEKELDHGKIKK